MHELINANILKESPSITANVFTEEYLNILSCAYESPAEFMSTACEQANTNNKFLKGKIFKSLIEHLLYRENIKPLYVRTIFPFLPNVTFDLVLYAEDIGPIVLSIKTSLRERYKQADLEGMFLRNVHRKAQSYLITMDEKAANSVNHKISTGHVLGLDKVIYAGGNDLTQLIDKLKQYTFFKPPMIEVMTAARIVE
ncbi:MAG: hypothetical protein JKX72_05770 [Robiginitomaculum sp.]|nr:hypothetical protein [Robiginitomaculum sp.]